MGWRLAEEIAWARPERPGPEWWTLLDIAQDARDETRQSMCGMDYLSARGKCSRRTILRRLESLRDQKLLTVARKSAPGIRAVYEIELIHRLPEMGDTNADTRTGDTNADTRQNERVTEPGPTGDKNRRTGDSVSGTHAVIDAVITPVKDDLPVVAASVEGNGLSTGQNLTLTFSETPNPNARHARKDTST